MLNNVYTFVTRLTPSSSSVPGYVVNTFGLTGADTLNFGNINLQNLTTLKQIIALNNCQGLTFNGNLGKVKLPWQVNVSVPNGITSSSSKGPGPTLVYLPGGNQSAQPISTTPVAVFAGNSNGLRQIVNATKVTRNLDSTSNVNFTNGANFGLDLSSLGNINNIRSGSQYSGTANFNVTDAPQ